MAHKIKNYRYSYDGPLMWKLGKALTPVLREISSRKKAANTPVSIGRKGAYAFLETRSHGSLITGTKGEAAFVWSGNRWNPLGNVAA